MTTTSPAPSNSEQPEIVSVPVPRLYLGVVYAALGAAMASETPSGPNEAAHDGAADGVLVDNRQGHWTEQMVERLQAKLDRYPGAKALLDLCADRAPEEVTLQEVVEHTGMEVTQIRAELGAMSKLSKRLFEGRKTWPISVRWTAQGVGNYTMKPQIATWWTNHSN